MAVPNTNSVPTCYGINVSFTGFGSVGPGKTRGYGPRSVKPEPVTRV